MTRVMVAAVLVSLCMGCGRSPVPVTVVRQYPADDVEGVIDVTKVAVDGAISHDGAGCFRITATEPTTVRLFETGDPGVSGGRLTYQAMMRAKDIKGKAYLEMWCQFSGEGEFFSRDLQTPLTGTVDWSSEETPFFLKQGEAPTNIKLNLVIEESGTVWIDAIQLLHAPLK